MNTRNRSKLRVTPVAAAFATLFLGATSAKAVIIVSDDFSGAFETGVAVDRQPNPSTPSPA